ncbi:hypothetical protein NDU88_005137 [Pleurodeles waltl]|uniref:Helix-turn-helix domain-containing protein n=1 Tax=Pleurodeles waltl TaxID=8319 RepID=A0AAV7WWR2_PLEWA|nr:hypothetical protein NDU88_005137 [Pleurodeles waltl]
MRRRRSQRRVALMSQRKTRITGRRTSGEGRQKRKETPNRRRRTIARTRTTEEGIQRQREAWKRVRRPPRRSRGETNNAATPLEGRGLHRYDCEGNVVEFPYLFELAAAELLTVGDRLRRRFSLGGGKIVAMEGEYVQAALLLLKKDLVQQEALPALRPARKAAQGVEAAVMACSPPRVGARPEQALLGSGGGALLERDGEFDPLVPLSRKWPTMLEWSAIESEGEEPEEVGDGRRGESPAPIARRGAPRLVYGERVPRGRAALNKEGLHFPGAALGGLGGATVFFTARVDDIAGTPDLYCQGERRGRGDPGKHRAAQPPWHEEQAEPGAAGRSASPGLPVWRRLVADAPEERCGGMGFALAGAAASWEQCPGPSGVQPVVITRRTAGTTAGELPQRAQEVLGHGNDLWREEFILDYEETGLEEEELVDDGDEEIWWEQGGAGPANALSQSLQGVQVQPFSRGKALEGVQMMRRKAQERPPSLTAGEEGASVTMISVAVEATDTRGLGAAHLSKGVYVANAGVGTEGTSMQEPIKGEGGEQTADVYYKPTDRNNLLPFQSFHPRSLRENLPMGQFLRLRRNCSNLSDYKKHANKLSTKLQEKDYPTHLVRRANKRARNNNRDQLLQPRENKPKTEQ